MAKLYRTPLFEPTKPLPEPTWRPPEKLIAVEVAAPGNGYVKEESVIGEAPRTVKPEQEMPPEHEAEVVATP